MKSTSKQGFTLVELSIVLVLIGLIVGGVMAGRDLLRQAEIRSLITQQKRITEAALTFQTKYNCVAGDCANATSYIATAVNGNGDSLFGTGTTNDGNVRGENYQFFFQLATLGLLDGTYPGTGANFAPIPGTDIPKSKAGNGGGWAVVTGYGILAGRNTLTMRAPTDAVTGDCYGAGNASKFYRGALTPLEMYGFDTKIDDGVAATGSVIEAAGGTNGSCGNWAAGVNYCLSSSAYDMSNSRPACGILMKL